jgi:hypothetical protein
MRDPVLGDERSRTPSTGDRTVGDDIGFEGVGARLIGVEVRILGGGVKPDMPPGMPKIPNFTSNIGGSNIA